MSNLCVIPARGGSKRVPRKNIRNFCGKPMIAWSIEAAVASGCFSRVIVSTDDPDIASIAAAHGAAVPFMRPASLSDDIAGVMPVVRHALEWAREHATHPRFVACVYATAPFLRPELLRQALQVLVESGADFVLPVVEFEYPVQRALHLNSGGCLEFVEAAHASSRSQDLPIRYHDAGQFFAGRPEAFQNRDTVLSSRCAPLRLDRGECIDIDTEEDWKLAEKMFGIRSK